MGEVIEYEFLKTAGRILNSGQSRTLLLTGNIHDLFFNPREGSGGEYLPLLDFLCAKWDLKDRLVVVYELNGPVRFLREEAKAAVREAWVAWRLGMDPNELAIQRMLSPQKKGLPDPKAEEGAFEERMTDAIGKPTLALELIRQMCLCSRARLAGKPLLRGHLIALIEGADLLIPEGEIVHLSDTDRHRIHICRDWFSDPGFMNGQDAVVLLAESRALLNHRIAQLPQVLEVPVPAPGEKARGHFMAWFEERNGPDRKLAWKDPPEAVARWTAGLSIQALRQLLTGALYEGRPLEAKVVTGKVEEFIQSQLGEEVIEFKKPAHRLEDVIGFDRLKAFLREELIPRFRSGGRAALAGAAVCGPIGGGKTFIFEALAAELDMVVLVLKNIRSQWFGQTDVIFERLRRTIEALDRVIIFIDEADTQFGGVGPETHDTERRLTGKIQAMMSDPRLRGRVVWLLMTARIHLLSPDIRRPGRVGDLIIPVLDPVERTERMAFLRWALDGNGPASQTEWDSLLDLTASYSSAAFASLRSELAAKAALEPLTTDKVRSVIEDILSPALQATRRFQTLQALLNCTRRSLLPDPKVSQEERERWERELRSLEAQGMR